MDERDYPVARSVRTDEIGWELSEQDRFFLDYAVSLTRNHQKMHDLLNGGFIGVGFLNVDRIQTVNSKKKSSVAVSSVSGRPVGIVFGNRFRKVIDRGNSEQVAETIRLLDRIISEVSDYYGI